MTGTEQPGLPLASDPATQAFDALREEVALLRRAIAGLTAERAALDVPDYTETLAQIARMVASIGKRLVAVMEMPAFGLTPDDLARRITEAATDARRQDRETILIGRDALRQAISDLTRTMQSARTAERQRRSLIWSAAGGAVAGMLFGVFAITPLFRLMMTLY